MAKQKGSERGLPFATPFNLVYFNKKKYGCKQKTERIYANDTKKLEKTQKISFIVLCWSYYDKFEPNTGNQCRQ